MAKMKAAVFVEPGRIVLEEKPIPTAGPGEAVIRMTTTTICGTDIHILKGEYPVEPGLTIGHEPIGVIHELGPGVRGYTVGQRVTVAAVTPCGQCYSCLDGNMAQCGGVPAGGWKLGNTIDGVQAEYALIPNAQLNLAPVPDAVTDEQILLVPDIVSTGFSASEAGEVRIGDTVAVFGLGPIGLCAVAGARLRGAGQVIGVDTVPKRLEKAKAMGADVTIDFRNEDPTARIKELTGGRGVDVAIEAVGLQSSFEGCMKSLRLGGTLSSLGVYSGKIGIELEDWAAGIGEYRIVSSTCPGGKERMRRLMDIVATGRVDFTSLVTHRYSIDDIEEAYAMFAEQRDGVVKVAITF
jgi:threonine dehydrogenase-like Zn-dependent dehydrogenase